LPTAVVVRDAVVLLLRVWYFSVDEDKGFFLNGKYLDLQGVNRHQDRAARGSDILIPRNEGELNSVANRDKIQ